MKRLSFALLLCACGSPAQPSVVSVPAASASGTQPHASIPVIAQRPPFALFISHRTCFLAHGKLRCRRGMDPEKSFGSEPIVPGLDTVDVESAAFGRDFGCVVVRGGDVRCFGSNHFGELGANVREERDDVPELAVGLHGATKIFAGPATACAIVAGGRVACWGKNQFGENGSTTNYLEAARELVEPQLVPGVDDVVDMALGWETTCAVTSKGKTLCWGRHKLADEQPLDAPDEVPHVVPSLEGIGSITANESAFCAIKEERVVCWGQVYMLTPNRGARHDLTTIPIPHARRVALGSSQGCAIDAEGAVWCFGGNHYGSLGVASIDGKYGSWDPVKVPGLPRATDVMSAFSVSCAITTGGEAWCWGRFSYDNEDTHPPTRMTL